MTRNPSKHEALADCFVFRGLKEQERGALVARAPKRTFARGETIFLMGSPGDSMMVVLRGTVRISVSSGDGGELMLAIVGRGEMFGEIALLDRLERTADATAMTACELAILQRREILSFLRHNPDTVLRLVDLLCSRLRRTDQHIADLALLPVPKRLAKVLLRLASADSRPIESCADGQIELSQTELAMMVGTSRESINKYLRLWQSHGLIRLKRNAIALLDRAVIAGLAESGHRAHALLGTVAPADKRSQEHVPKQFNQRRKSRFNAPMLVS
jgi:CRP/FNR family cyclic AMP-dependent transcriptional regulator